MGTCFSILCHRGSYQKVLKLSLLSVHLNIFAYSFPSAFCIGIVYEEGEQVFFFIIFNCNWDIFLRQHTSLGAGILAITCPAVISMNFLTYTQYHILFKCHMHMHIEVLLLPEKSVN